MEIDTIASVKAGDFQAWFEHITDHYEIQWYDGHSPRAFRFATLGSAKEFWHENVIDRKNFKHCYCC